MQNSPLTGGAGRSPWPPPGRHVAPPSPHTTTHAARPCHPTPPTAAAPAAPRAGAGAADAGAAAGSVPEPQPMMLLGFLEAVEQAHVPGSR
jgi:hypothetical protein